VPTDHACQAAAEQAARGITPVRAVLAPPLPAPAPRPPEEDIPIVIRQYLDPGGAYAREEETPATADPPEPEPVGTAMGGVVLITFLDGLRTDLTGSIAEWYAELMIRIPHALSLAATMAPEMRPPRMPSEWQAMAELKKLGEELLTVIARMRPEDRVNQISWRLALVEDTFAGALRRLDIPVDLSVRSATDVAAAALSMFGMQRQSG
jgi:hypothetical protein